MNSHLTTFQKRPISPSCLTSWYDEFNKDPNHEKWARHYLLGEKSVHDDETQERMEKGTAVHERLAKDPKFLPTVPRYDSFEDEFFTSYGTIPLTGKLDTLRADLHAFCDYKTTQSDNYWSQSKANKNIQFLFYFLLLYLKFDIRPEDVDCKIAVIHLNQKNRVEIFTVKHSMLKIVEFLGELKDVHAEMCKFAKKYVPPTNDVVKPTPKVVKLNYKALKIK